MGSVRAVICARYRNHLIYAVSKGNPPHFKTASASDDGISLKSVATWLLAISALVMALVGAYFLGASNASVTEVEILIPTPAPVVVQITGEVRSPGVYELNRDDRVLTAIEAAGGMTDKADIERLNLAATVSDGSLIHVPLLLTEAEAVPPGSVASNDVAESKATLPGTANTNVSTEPINLNSATVDQLKSLPGIGETRANQIIELRNAVGPFSTLDQLLDIHGIGEKTLEAIRSMVVVE